MHSYLSRIDWQDRTQRLCNKKVALYGAGKYGKNAMTNIKKYLPQLEILCFLDDDKIRNSENIEGIGVATLEEAVRIYGDFSILITNYYVASVLRKIEKAEFDIDKVFFWSELLIEDIDYAYLKENQEKLCEAYNSLSDDLSKMIFQNMVNSRWDKNIDFLSRTCEKEQYFPMGIFEWNEEEVFVDAGAYDGDTIENFLAVTRQKYKYIYAFEPDEKNYKKLLQRGFEDKIQIFHAGLYNENGEVHFSGNKGGSSKVEEEGTCSIPVLKFDDLQLPEKDITFIKMDIEGSELSALYGMKKTIIKNKPKLAICIYHKFEDLWELPLYIKSLVPDYKLYIRNYTTYLDEIVLYAAI